MSEQPTFPSGTTSSNFAQFLAELDDAAFWKYAVQEAQTPINQALTEDSELLLCSLEEVSCLLPLLYLREVLSAPHQYTSLPLTPQWMLGVMAWQGETIPLLDLSAYLMQHPARWHANDTLLITESANTIVAWLVPEIGALPVSLLDAEIDLEQPTSLADSWYSHLVPTEVVIKAYNNNLPLLDLSLLIAEATQSIEGATSYDE